VVLELLVQMLHQVQLVLVVMVLLHQSQVLQ
jgi:hypothetical protein